MQSQSSFILQSLNDLLKDFSAIRTNIDRIIMECMDSVYERIANFGDIPSKCDLLKSFKMTFDEEVSKDCKVDEKYRNILLNIENELYGLMESKISQIKIDLHNKKSVDFIMSELKVTENINYKSKKGCIGYAMADMPSWDILAVGTNEGDIYCFDSQNFSLVSELIKAHSGWIMCLNFHEDLNQLFSASTDNSIKVFTIQKKTLVLITTLNSHKSGVNGILFIPNQNMFVSFGKGSEIKLWNTHSLLEIDSIICDEDKMGIQSCYVDELKAFGIGFYNGKIKFYNIFSKLCILTLNVENSGYYINSLIFDSKFKLLIAQVNSKTISIWKFQKNSFEFSKDIKVKGHANYFILLNDILLTCCDQPNIEVWDIQNLKKIREIPLPSPMKNSNGMLLLRKNNKINLVVSSWNVNKLVVFDKNL